MKRTIVAIAMAMTLAAPAWAGSGPIAELAEISGLSERKVNMVLGNRTSFAEYPYTYQRALEQFQATVGKENHARLMRGETIAVHYNGEVRLLSLSRRNAEVDTTL